MMDEMNDPDSQFDRLVDGELSGEEYRQLIASLDDEPDGWRRCATAFLEAQAWGSEIRTLRSGVEQLEVRPDSQSARRTANTLNLLFAMAVSFVVAFGLGVMLRTWWPIGSSEFGELPVVDTNHIEHIENVAPQMVDQKTQFANSDGAAKPGRENLLDQPSGHITFVGDGTAASNNEPIRVPFFDWGAFNPDWLADPPFSVSQEVERAFNRFGHKVFREQRIVPISLRDGRRVFIPVEDVEIMPVEGGSIQ